MLSVTLLPKEVKNVVVPKGYGLMAQGITYELITSSLYEEVYRVSNKTNEVVKVAVVERLI